MQPIVRNFRDDDKRYFIKPSSPLIECRQCKNQRKKIIQYVDINA